jgi:hypothetical protein
MGSRNVMMRGFAAPGSVVVTQDCPAGLDPGKDGWAVAEMPDGSLRTWKIPTIEVKKAGTKKKSTQYDLDGVIAMLRDMKAVGVSHVTLEAQQPTRLRGSQAGANNAVRASFMTGYGFALWELGLKMVGIDYHKAWPSAWKRKMGITAPKGTADKQREKVTKQLSREAGQRLYPEHNFIPPRCRVASHDQCEAALLIQYGKDKGWTP